MRDVVVIGAGISGVFAAWTLQAAGVSVTVLDKGRRAGGRMATRRIDGATWDQGAQFFTVTDPRFETLLGQLAPDAHDTWFAGSPDLGRAGQDGHPRYRGVPYMRAVPEAVADRLDLRLRTRATALTRSSGRWRVELEGAPALLGDGVVVTAPGPQAVELLAAGDVRLPDDTADALHGLDYDPCWSVLVVPDGTPDLPDHGALRQWDHPLHFVTDNHRKGISVAPSVTLHASAEWSRARLEDDAATVGARLLDDAAPWVRGTVAHVHRWRYSAPRPGPDLTGLVATTPGPIAFAGDALSGGRVEGAALSGLAAAEALLAMR